MSAFVSRVDAPSDFGAFAESAARAVADDIAAKINASGPIAPYDGTGSCYIEFGHGEVGRKGAGGAQGIEGLRNQRAESGFHGVFRAA